jgi:hypothetical protein
VVIAAVGDRFVGAQPRSADPSLHRPEAVDERQELGDVVAVATVRVIASGIPAGSLNRWCF